MTYWSLKEVKNKYWKNTIKVSFTWKFQENKDFYDVNTLTNNFAELRPKVSSNEILKFFLDSNLNINKFEFSEPSLNDIFISINEL